VYAEEFKIAAEIEDIEFIFILTIQQSFAKSCSSAYHLPEFRLTHYFLKENKINDLGYVNTCIHHIHGNNNPGI